MTGEKNWSHHPLCSKPVGWRRGDHARQAEPEAEGQRCPRYGRSWMHAGQQSSHAPARHFPTQTSDDPCSSLDPTLPHPCVHTCTHSTHAQAHAHVHTAAAPPHAESNRAVPGRQRHSVAHRRTAGPDASGTFKEGSTQSGPGFLHRRKHRGRGQHLKPSVVPRNPPGIPHKASSASATSSN